MDTDDTPEVETKTLRTRARQFGMILLGRIIFRVVTGRLLTWLLLAPETHHLRIGGAFVVSVVLIGFGIYKLAFLFDFTAVKLFVDSYPFLSRSGGFLLVLFAGIALYSIKRKARLAYGLVETGLALAAGWQAVGNLDKGNFSELFAFVASIYFAVRGAENSYLGFVEFREFGENLRKQRVEAFLKLPNLPIPSPNLPEENVQRITEAAAIIAGKIR